uniref:Uncharacterized protein n=1 Tax=Aureoumbra lagunensis TaxID=44058 RepID=A0A7S3K0K4_9STRA
MEGWAILLQEELRSWSLDERCGSIASNKSNERRGVAIVANARLGVACCWLIGEGVPHRTVATKSTEQSLSPVVLVAGEISAAVVCNEVIFFNSSDSSRWCCGLLGGSFAQMAVWGEGETLIIATAAGELWSARWGLAEAERLGGTELGNLVDTISEQASRQRGRGLLGLTLGAVRAVGSFSARKLRLGQRQEEDDDDEFSYDQSKQQQHQQSPVSSSACALDYHGHGILLYARRDGVLQLWESDRGVRAIYEARSDGFKYSGETRLLRFDDTVAIMIAIEQHSERTEQRIITMNGQIGPCRSDSRSVAKARFGPPVIMHAVQIGVQIYSSVLTWTKLRLLEIDENKTIGCIIDALGSSVTLFRLKMTDGRLSLSRARQLDSPILDAAPQRGGLLLLETGGTTRVLSTRELGIEQLSEEEASYKIVDMEEADERTSAITGESEEAVEKLVETCRNSEEDTNKEVVLALKALAIRGANKATQLSLAVEASRQITEASPRSGLVAESGELALTRLEAKCRSHKRLVVALSSQGQSFSIPIMRIAQHAEFLESARHLCEQHALLAQQDHPEPLTASCRNLVASAFDANALNAAGLSALDAYYGQPPSRCLDALYLILEDGGIEIVRLAVEVLVAGREALSASLASLLRDSQTELPSLGPSAARVVVAALSRLEALLLESMNKKKAGGSRIKSNSQGLNDTYTELSFRLASLACHAKCDELAVRVCFLSAKSHANDGDIQTFRTQAECVLDMCKNRGLRRALIELCLDTESIEPGMGLRHLRLSATTDTQLSQLALTILTDRGRFADALDLAPLCQQNTALSTSNFIWLQKLSDRQYMAAKGAMPTNSRSLDALKVLSLYSTDDTLPIEHQLERRLEQTELSRALQAAGANVSINEEDDDDERAYAIFDAAMHFIESSGAQPIEQQVSLLSLAATAHSDLNTNDLRRNDDVTPLARLWSAAVKADASVWLDAADADFGGLVISQTLRRTTFFAFVNANPEGPLPNDLERGLHRAGFDSDILPRLKNLLLASQKRAADDYAAVHATRATLLSSK